MREINVKKGEQSSCEHVRVIQQALEDMDKRRRSKVYRTMTSSASGVVYEFVTTSKDTHLGLGALDEQVRAHLAALIYTEYQESGDAEILLNIGEEESLLATIANREVRPAGGRVTIHTIHISPAR